MKKRYSKHWGFVPTGVILSLLIIIFWCLNQNLLSQNKGPVALLFENPLLTFGLIILGAFFSAFLSGDFGIRTPVTYEPLILSVFGGVIMGMGAVMAAMSLHSVVLFNLAGIFILTAFMVTKGWIYAVFMVAGGFLGSKIFLFFILKTKRLKKDFFIPKALQDVNNQKIVFFVLLGLFTLFVLAVAVFSVLSRQEKIVFSLGVLLLVLFGAVVERGTICMSSMLKEWFLAHSAYVWRSVLFTIMCLAFLYQLGLYFALYPQIQLEPYISNPGLLMLGSFFMGIGFIFADGCFIGSLWKAGQGNIINIAGIWGMLVGMEVGQVGFKLFLKTQNPAFLGTGIPNYLSSILNPRVFLILLWVIGVLLLLTFKQKHYKY